jgi:hypothetical protein
MMKPSEIALLLPALIGAAHRWKNLEIQLQKGGIRFWLSGEDPRRHIGKPRKSHTREAQAGRGIGYISARSAPPRCHLRPAQWSSVPYSSRFLGSTYPSIAGSRFAAGLPRHSRPLHEPCFCALRH